MSTRIVGQQLSTAELVVDNATDSTSASTGSIQTAGGIGVTKNVFVDGSVLTDTINEATATAGVTIDGVLLKDNKTTTNGVLTSDTITSLGTNFLTNPMIDMSIGGAASSYRRCLLDYYGTDIRLRARNWSNTYAGNLYLGNHTSEMGGSGAGTRVRSLQPLTVTVSDASTSTTTGALVVSGGTGIGGDLNVAGTATITTELKTDTINEETTAAGVTIDGMLVKDNSVRIIEQASVPAAPGAGNGTIWVRNDTPNNIVFTDDAGTDHVLNQAGGGENLSATLAIGNTTGGNDIVTTSGDSILGETAGTGGAVTVQGGTSTTSAQPGGAANLIGGTPGATGVGGAITINAGAGGGTSGNGGAVTVDAGDATSGTGGAITITGGTGTVNGGNTTMKGGAGTAGINGGVVQIQGGDGGSGGGVGGGLQMYSGDGDGGNGYTGDILLTTSRTGGNVLNGSVGKIDITTGTNAATAGAIGAINIAGGTHNSAGIGGAINIDAGDNIGTGTGGALSLTSGSSRGANTGGTLSITGGQGGPTGAGAPLNITAGAGGSTSGNGGEVAITGGSVTSGNKGVVNVDGVRFLDSKIVDANRNELLEFASVASAVSNVEITNAAAGNRPIISTKSATGNLGLDFHNSSGEIALRLDGISDDFLTIQDTVIDADASLNTDVAITIIPKGTGNVIIDQNDLSINDAYFLGSAFNQAIFKDENLNELMVLRKITNSAVGFVEIGNAATGVDPLIRARTSGTLVGLEFQDTADNELLVLKPTASATVYAEIASNTGDNGGVIISSKTSDATNPGFAFRDKNDNDTLRLTPGTAAVNYLAISSSNTGVSLDIAAVGLDSNIDIDINPQGTGVVNADNLRIKDGDIVDANGNELLEFGTTASAISHIKITNSGASEGSPIISSTTSGGSDIGIKFQDNNGDNILNLGVGGDNYLNVATGTTGGGTPAIWAFGTTDANVSIDLQPQGSGTVNISGNGLKLPTSAGTASELEYYEDGSFTIAWDVLIPSVVRTVYYTRIGKMVTLNVQSVSGTTTGSGSRVGTTAQIAAKLRPVIEANCIVRAYDGSVYVATDLRVTTSGLLGLYRLDTANWGSGVSFGMFEDWTISYNVA